MPLAINLVRARYLKFCFRIYPFNFSVFFPLAYGLSDSMYLFIYLYYVANVAPVYLHQ